MTWQLGQYYVAFVAAILLARGLGPLFFFPLLIDFALELCLDWRLLSGWDIRLVITVWEFGIFLWVLALAGNLRRSTVVVMLVADVVVLMRSMWPQLAMVGNGQEFWNDTSTSIINVWQTSVLVIILSMVIRNTVVAKFKGEFIDILTNPKKRFLLPIGAWAFVQMMPFYLRPFVPEWLYDHRFPLSANVLVWGWVALELPFYLMYRRFKKQYS